MSLDLLFQICGSVHAYLFPSDWVEAAALPLTHSGVISRSRDAVTGGSALSRQNNQRETKNLGMKEAEKDRRQ